MNFEFGIWDLGLEIGTADFLNLQPTTHNEQPAPCWPLRIDCIALFSLTALVISLPIAKISSVRDICLILVFLCWLSRAVLTGQWRPRTTGVEAAWIIYGVFIVISLFTAVDFSYSLDQFRGEYLKNFLLFMLVAQFVTTEAGARAVLVGIAAGNLMMVSVGIAEFVMLDGSLITRVAYRDDGWSSLHLGGGTYSTYLITVFPFLFWLITVWKKWWVKALTIALVAANLFSIYITFQRGAWVAFLMMLVTAIFLVPRKNWVKGACLAAFLAALGVALWLAPEETVIHEENIEGIGQLILEPENSIGKRFTTWRVSLEYILDDPIMGAGFGRRSPYKKYDYYRRDDTGFYWHAHNTFLNLGLELGIPGLLAFVFLLGRLCLIARQGYGRSGPGTLQHFFRTALILTTTGVVFRNVFDDFFIDDSAMLFWFLAAMVVGVTAGSKKVGSRE